MRRIAMLVRNDVRHDARVRREAAALSARYRVTVFGLDRGTPYGGGDAFDVHLIDAGRERAPDGSRSDYVRFVMRAIATLQRHRPDVVHAHDLDALIPCAIAAVRLRVPLVYDAHELYAEQGRHGRLGQKLLRSLEDVAMTRAAAILAANESRAEVMWREYRCPVRPVTILNCPEATSAAVVADGRLASWVAAQGRRWRGIVIYQGGLSLDRHLRELARAALSLPPETGIVFLGEGPAEESIRRAGGGRVLLHPLVPVGELLSFIAGADVGVVTYANTCRNNYLCAPNKLFDYAGAGLPMAVGDLPELARMVTDFDAGIVFRNGDPESMAREITALLSDATRLRRAGAGASRLAQHFTWKGEAEKLLQVYDQILPQPW